MQADLMVNIARWLPRSSVNGPGERFVLWVQGCPLHCPGCWNPDTWSFASRRLFHVNELEKVISSAMPIDGVTFSGGEPFAQADVLVVLAERLRDMNLSLMAFTGYDLHELTTIAQRRLLACLDIVVTGRFVRSMAQENLRWRGSSNQQVHFLTQRHHDIMGSAVDEPSVEVVIDAKGCSVVSGFPSPSLVAALTVRGIAARV
jgi:anaerobic ribonucleoside-triphosphate reductase activating protein